MSTDWKDIPSPLAPPPTTEEIASVEQAGMDAILETAGLDSVFIMTSDGRRIPALVDQSSRTVYPKRYS